MYSSMFFEDIYSIFRTAEVIINCCIFSKDKEIYIFGKISMSKVEEVVSKGLFCFVVPPRNDVHFVLLRQHAYHWATICFWIASLSYISKILFRRYTFQWWYIVIVACITFVLIDCTQSVHDRDLLYIRFRILFALPCCRNR